MGTPMTYISGNTGAYQSGTFNKGTIALNLNPSSLASGNNWYNGVDVTATQYLIYSDTYSTGIATQANSKPTAWTTPDLSDTSLLNLINTLPDRVGLTPFTSLPLALQWLNATNEYFLIKTNFENIVTSGLVLNLDAGWYNSYSGTTTWFDIKGGYNGTLTNGPTFNGGSQGAIVFDGTDDYVNLGSIAQITPGTGDFTIDFWINPTNWSNTYMPLLTTTVTNGIWIGKVENNFALRTYNVADDLQSTTFPTPGVWTNVIIQRSGNIATIYYNTISIVSGTVTRNYAQGTTEIARDGVTSVFNGKISTVKYYNRALSPQEILQNYNAQKSRFGFYDIVQSGNTLNLSASNYLSYPRSGTTWFDMTSTGNNGTFVNGPTFNTGATPSIQFDGADDYINIPNGFTKTLKGKQYWTASIWVKVTSWGSGNDSFPVLVSIGENQGQYTELYLEIGNVNQYYMAYAGDFTAGSMTINLNQVYNLVYMKDGSSFKVYRDGVLIDTVTGKNNVSNVDGDLWIGRFKTGDYELNGNIYNFSMYDRALSESEIVQNFESQRNIYGATGYTTSGLTLNLDAGNYASYPTTGTKWVDISGNYNNTTLINNPVWSNTSGGTITFDGSDDFATITRTNSISPTTAISQESWVNFNSSSDTQVIIGMQLGDSSNNSYALWYQGGQFSGEVGANGNFDNIGYTWTPTVGTWYHLSHTYDGTIQRLYINGVQVQTKNTSGLINYNVNNTKLVIGGDYNSGYDGGLTARMNGKISIVRIYDRALSASEITQNYNSLKGRFGL
jgi:hypothetical protein